MPTALIVEDEAIIALDLAAELQAFGLDILGPAKTYEQAMEIVSRTLPDIAIVDVVLNGLAHGSRIAADLRTRGVRVLVTSGGEPSADCDAVFLAKPWTRDDLMHALGILPELAD
jgi:two-component system, response regulator PdtaR